MTARHTDWTHVHVADGDKRTAAPYVSFGRKLLGYVTEQAKLSGITQNKATKRFNDGTVVSAEIKNGIPLISIVSKHAKKPISPVWAEGLVVTSVSASSVMLVIEKERTISLFHSAKLPEYAAAPAPKGSWLAAQPELKAYYKTDSQSTAAFSALRKRYGINNEYHVFLHSINHVNKKGEAVSWTGTDLSNYWHPANVMPQQRHLGMVSSRGRTVYSVYTDNLGIEGLQIMGSAIKDGYLYVVLAYAFYAYTYPDPPSTPAPQEVFAPKGTVPFDGPVIIRKIKLVEKLDDTVGHVYYEATTERTNIFSGYLRNADCPWVFNEDVTEVVCIARPDENRLIWSYTPGQPDGFFETNLVVPSETHRRYRCNLQTGAMQTDDPGDVVAEDSGKTLRLERVNPNQWDWVWEGGRVTAFNMFDDYEQRTLVAADVRNKRYAFRALSRTNNNLLRWTEVYDGTHSEASPPEPSGTNEFAMDEIRARLSLLEISPYALLQLYAVGCRNAYVTYADKGTAASDFTLVGSQYVNKNGGSTFDASSFPKLTPLLLYPLLHFPLLGMGRNSTPLMYGGVAFTDAVMQFDPGKKFIIRQRPGDLPDHMNSLKYRDAFTPLFIRSIATGGTKECWFVKEQDEEGISYMTGANAANKIGGITAWGVQVWGKPPPLQQSVTQQPR